MSYRTLCAIAIEFDIDKNTSKLWLTDWKLLGRILYKENIMATKCKFCGSSSYGSCTKSPHKFHEHIDDEKHCVFCGSSSYGSCTKSPHKNHQHGSGGNKCVFCGSTSTGSCTKSPHGKHQK